MFSPFPRQKIMQIEVLTIKTEMLMYEILLIKAGQVLWRARRQSGRGLPKTFLVTFQKAAVCTWESLPSQRSTGKTRDSNNSIYWALTCTPGILLRVFRASLLWFLRTTSWMHCWPRFSDADTKAEEWGLPWQGYTAVSSSVGFRLQPSDSSTHLLSHCLDLFM